MGLGDGVAQKRVGVAVAGFSKCKSSSSTTIPAWVSPIVFPGSGHPLAALHDDAAASLASKRLDKKYPQSAILRMELVVTFPVPPNQSAMPLLEAPPARCRQSYSA